MSYMSGSRAARNADSISNRGCYTGGSCGGNKKAGILTYGPSWSRGNMGNFLNRAPQATLPLPLFLLNTTRNPTQGTNYQVYRRGGLM